MDKIRWGIVGTGGIAHRFAEAVTRAESAQLQAVASRAQSTADAFGDEFSVPRRFASYEAMALSGEIDAAYIGVPHGCHAEAAMLFLNQKIPVLCEKPMAVNAAEAKKMIDCARANDTFLMEAMWGRVVEGTKRLISIAESGDLGEIMGVRGCFCYDMSDEPDHHAFKPQYGGGSLLDVGVYALNFASWYLGNDVTEIKAVANIGESKVDVHLCGVMKYASGAIAEISSAMLLRKPNEGFVFGTKGYVRVPRFYAPQQLEINIDGEEPRVIETPYIGNGFEEQIIEVGRCIREGKKESDFVPLGQTLFITEQMDLIRKQVGVEYPQDR